MNDGFPLHLVTILWLMARTLQESQLGGGFGLEIDNLWSEEKYF
jgi:hypothetical protein